MSYPAKKYGVPRTLPDGRINPEWKRRHHAAIMADPEWKAERTKSRKEWESRNKNKLREYNRDYQRRWRDANREQHRATDRKNKAKLRKCKPHQYWTYMRKFHLKRKYNMVPRQYEDMLNKQDRKCSICNKEHVEASKKRLHIDHCHTTEKVRELLCNDCNNMLGRAHDRIDVLEKAIEYLKRHA